MRSEPPQTTGTGPTLRAVCEAVWAAEERLGLLEWETGGVWPWVARRFAVFKRLAAAASIFEAAVPGPAMGWGGRLARQIGLLPGALTRNPFGGTERPDVLIFESPRTGEVEGRRGCIYTHYLANDLTTQGRRVGLLDWQQGGTHTKSPDPRRRFMDAVEIEASVRTRLIRWAPSTADVTLVEEVGRLLSRECGTAIDLRPLLVSSVARFLAERDVYRRLLEKRSPKEIICVCSYDGLSPLVAAAKGLGIPVTEVQHGMLSRYHLGYSYPVLPPSGKIEYFPDRFLAWRGAWGGRVKLPCEVQEVGFPHCEAQRARYAATSKREKLMVVLSQPVIARRLAQVLMERLARLAPLEIVIRAHPLERRDPRWHAAFDPLLAYPNVRLGEDEDLYELLAQATYQLGVLSTALYEGMEMGCRTLLVPLPGIEYMEEVLAAGDAELLDDFLSRMGW